MRESAMALYSVRTRLSPDQVIERAVLAFGPEGLGLEISERDACCVTFLGGGGHITITPAAGEGRTTVDLETREWDYHVKRFMREIA
jgi:hypothetical protein